MGDPVVATDIWNSAAFFSSLQFDLAGVGANAGVGAGATNGVGAGAGQVGPTTNGSPVPAETDAAASVAPTVAAPMIPTVAAVDEASPVEEPATSNVLKTSVISVTSPSRATRTSSGARAARSRSSRPDTAPSATQTVSSTSDLSSNAQGTSTIPPEAATAPVSRSTLTTWGSTPNTDLPLPGSASRSARVSSSQAASSIGPSASSSVSAGVKAAIALGVIIFIFIVVVAAGLLWRRKRKARNLPELPSRDDKTVGRFELATESSKSNTRRGSCEKSTGELDSPHPADWKYGSFSSGEKPAWRPWRLSRWRGRQELDGGWKPPEMQGRKFHEKGAP